MESAGPVFDAIFTYVDNPPPMPMVDNPEGVIKWLKRHVREPLDTYFAYDDASVQDIKACARAAGFTGNTTQGTLLTYMAFKSRVQAYAVKLVAAALVEAHGDEGDGAGRIDTLIGGRGPCSRRAARGRPCSGRDGGGVCHLAVPPGQSALPISVPQRSASAAAFRRRQGRRFWY